MRIAVWGPSSSFHQKPKLKRYHHLEQGTSAQPRVCRCQVVPSSVEEATRKVTSTDSIEPSTENSGWLSANAFRCSTDIEDAKVRPASRMSSPPPTTSPTWQPRSTSQRLSWPRPPPYLTPDAFAGQSGHDHPIPCLRLRPIPRSNL